MLFENIVEQSSINQEIDQHFHIDIKSTSTSVILKVECHCKNLDPHVTKNLDYREDILKWKDQVRLLNTVKGYGIAHQTSSVRAKGMYKKSILLQPPNLV